METTYAEYLLKVNSYIRTEVATEKRIRQNVRVKFWSTGFTAPPLGSPHHHFV